MSLTRLGSGAMSVASSLGRLSRTEAGVGGWAVGAARPQNGSYALTLGSGPGLSG